MKEVSVVQFFDLTEDQKEEYRLLDNIIAEKAEDNLKNIEIILKKLDIPELTALYADKDLNLQMIDIKLNRTLNILDII
ncbi:MAG: hypothetical protein LBG52_07005 [Candidatus Peribacteria bacterium]|jgi:hypothetical protein|nr:hypothetical protein [Candidatus Peribacteria bacterium]